MRSYLLVKCFLFFFVLCTSNHFYAATFADGVAVAAETSDLSTNSMESSIAKGVNALRSRDYVLALKVFKPLSALGYAGAQYHLGWMYEFGEGVPKDYKEAVRLYSLAANQSDSDARYKLGVMYANGKGVAQDYKEAMRFYGLAVAQGNADGRAALGSMYELGHGVPQDYVIAHMWYNIGSISDVTLNALISRDELAKKMTASQLEKAQDLARECVMKNYKGC